MCTYFLFYSYSIQVLIIGFSLKGNWGLSHRNFLFGCKVTSLPSKSSKDTSKLGHWRKECWLTLNHFWSFSVIGTVKISQSITKQLKTKNGALHFVPNKYPALTSSLKLVILVEMAWLFLSAAVKKSIHY